MPARLIEANPLVEEARNQVAIERGPIVYCLESPDLPKGVRVQDVTIPADAELTARFDPKLLGGVTVIETTALAKPSGDWSDQLYRPLQPRAGEGDPRAIHPLLRVVESGAIGDVGVAAGEVVTAVGDRRESQRTLDFSGKSGCWSAATSPRSLTAPEAGSMPRTR